MSYEVIFEPNAEEDLRQIATTQPRVAKAALDIAKTLRANPYLGDEMSKRPRLELLADCRRIRFDELEWRDKPRYPLVYRNKPSDGAPHVVAILAIGERGNLRAYRDAVQARGRATRVELAQAGAPHGGSELGNRVSPANRPSRRQLNGRLIAIGRGGSGRPGPAWRSLSVGHELVRQKLAKQLGQRERVTPSVR